MLYPLRDLIKEVGRDAVRYFFSMNSFDTPMEFNVGLARQRSNQNPVYYVQYAHARIESIIKNIREKNPVNLDVDKHDLAAGGVTKMKFKNKDEKQLSKTLMLYPDVVYNSCRNNAPHLMTQFLYRLAQEFHYFYNNHRVIKEGKEGAVVDIDRFILILLVRRVLKNALKLLNIDAPEKM
jgi:arginyl-tRNA synthetase